MAARWMAQKVSKLKTQNVALAQMEYSKACYFTSKPEVPSYNDAMVQRIEPATKARKTVYRASKPLPLTRTGMACGYSTTPGKVGQLIKRK